MLGGSAGTRQQPQPAEVLSVQSVAGSVHPLSVFAATCGYIIVLRSESTASSSTSTDNCKQASNRLTRCLSYKHVERSHVVTATESCSVDASATMCVCVIDRSALEVSYISCVYV